MKEREQCRLKKWSVKKKNKRRKEEEIKTSKVCGGLSYVVTLLNFFFVFFVLGSGQSLRESFLHVHILVYMFML